MYPHLGDLRKSIEEIKMVNTAVEQFVVGTQREVKGIKKVERYMKVKAHSNTYL